MKNETKRDGALTSPWQINLTKTGTKVSEPIDGNLYDCLIVGAGITGLTAALFLAKAGKKVIVAEAQTTGFGTTGGTSAHINNFADTTYKEAESAFGKNGAKLFAEAVNEGFEIIKHSISEYNIDCDYEAKSAFIYAEDADQVKQLDSLYDGLMEVEIPAGFIAEIPVNIPFKTAIKLDDQAQFHPLKYLQALEKEYIDAGGELVEHQLIEKVSTENGIHTADSKGISIKAKNVVYATHMPPNINVLNLECAPYRSYVLGVSLRTDEYPNDLVYDLQDPYHYFRTHIIDGKKLLIAGGNDHKTGHEDAEKVFDDLEKYVRKHFDVASVKYKWSSQYYVPIDGLPYIGQMPLTAKGIYCATGFNGNGMMFGSVAARIISDLIITGESKYKELFDPGRIKPVDGFTEFVSENSDVAYHFVADRFGIDKIESLKAVKRGMGELVEIEGKKIAAYRDDNDKIHALNPVCTHMGCVVNWNAAEKSWDCPCHGARFDIDGKVLTGPATIDLEKFE